MHGKSKSGNDATAAIGPDAEAVHQDYPNELKRWTIFLSVPMLAACLSICLAFGTRFSWFYAGAIAFGPGLGILAIIYLAISSDTNTTPNPPAGLNQHPQPQPRPERSNDRRKNRIPGEVAP
jgi:hypothetical protein